MVINPEGIIQIFLCFEDPLAILTFFSLFSEMVRGELLFSRGAGYQAQGGRRIGGRGGREIDQEDPGLPAFLTGIISMITLSRSGEMSKNS